MAPYALQYHTSPASKDDQGHPTIGMDFFSTALHLLKHKKYVQKQLHKFFTTSAQNIHTLREDFHHP